MSKKEAYVEEKKSELNKWKKEMEELQRKAKDAQGELKIKLDAQLAELQTLWDEGRGRVNRLAEASEDAWEGVRDEVDHTWKAFRSSVNYFRSHFKHHEERRDK